MISLSKMAPKYSANVLCSGHKQKKTVLCLMEKICVLDKLCSGVNYSAVGCEFNVNELTTYIGLSGKSPDTVTITRTVSVTSM